MTTHQNLELVLQAAESGALVLTSNTRAARSLRREFSDRQRIAGREVWKSPNILPWPAWLRRLWQEQIYSSSGTSAALLDKTQERIVWERIISTERAAHDVILLAEQCAKAWRLMHEFRVPRERTAFQRKKDTEAFYGWAETYTAKCLKNGWLDEARLPDTVHESAISECAGRKLALWGFDRFTPQQQNLIDALRAAGIVCDSFQPDGDAADAQRISLDDTHAELRTAAQWARRLLEESPETSIGIVVPNLDEIRGSVERVLLEVLHPDGLTIEGSERRRAFDISLGTPLSHTPVVGSALALLDLAAGPVSLEKASRLLRSTFIGSDEELGVRSLLDCWIRTKGLSELSIETLHEFASKKSDTPRFATSMRRLRDAVSKLPKRQMASRWSREVVALLSTAGWPGSRDESSTEHQAKQAFADLLAKFSKFDVVLDAMDLPTMVRRLSTLADETLHQAENLGSPIQIVGVLEAAGSRFEHLWVVGMHADAWPPAQNPSPFLPLELQRKLGVAGCSSDERLEYARQVTNRILRSSSRVIFSTPLRQGDTELSPSPLIAGYPTIDREELDIASYEVASEVLYDARHIETCEDAGGPGLTEPRSKGGTRIFQLQAACPFRAFTELRLGAKELEIPKPGIDRRLRGKLLHQAQYFLWQELNSQQELKAKSQVELEEIARRCVDRAVNESDAAALTGWERHVVELERQRLTQLVVELLKLEAQRQLAFRIAELEQKKDVQFGGVATDVKVDRVDVLDDGRFVLLDYKSGEPKVTSWEGERPDEPQLPVYATQLRDQLAAVAFVQVAKGEIEFKGYAKNDRLLPDMKGFDSLPPSKRPTPTWKDMLDGWQHTLERLGADYRSGRAVVDPKKKATCERCHLSMVCRIDDAPLAAEEDEADE